MSRSLPVAVPHQDRDNWCWAAVGAGMREFHFQAPVTQCQVAAVTLNNNACCANPAVCDVPNRLEIALNAVRCLSGLPIAGPVSFQKLIEQIEILGRPVCIHFSWRGGGPQHFAAITGCAQSPGLTITIQDPFRGTLTYDYAQALTNYEGQGVWDFTYLTARQAP